MISDSDLQTIVEASNRYGSDTQYVFGGGGNTSVKSDELLAIKASGFELGTIVASQFVLMDRKAIQTVYDYETPADKHEREALIKDVMAAAVCKGSSGRPSVEAPLHELIPEKFVIHTHSILTNGMTCAKNGKSVCAELFPKAMWVAYIDPGYTLAVEIQKLMKAFVESEGYSPRVIILENHGIFVSGNTIEEIDAEYDNVMTTLQAEYDKVGLSMDLDLDEPCADTVAEFAPALRSILADGQLRKTINSAGYFAVVDGPLTPDHIVYAKSYPMIADATADNIAKFEADKGYKPYIIVIEGKAVFSVEKNLKSARLAMESAKNAKQVEQLTHAFGGPQFLTDEQRIFIEEWEVESYRKTLIEGGNEKRLQGKIALITGGAQGFGLGIAKGLADNGAQVIIADMNLDGAKKAADEINAAHAKDTAIALEVNIADESSMEAMCTALLKETGGLDILVANAGVVRSGSVKEMELKDFDFNTSVNYTGYFLSAKHLARIMAKQYLCDNCDWCDIIQINSKSGLEGSNKNAAYAGSKFGGIGLTQSFALELVEDHVKVNAVCPGNYLDGPLWSDPEKGVFIQYLKAGKVPGAKTVEDVRKAYEAKVPMNRGCLPEDVLKAILYIVEQKYETGQAVPVTGGQVMMSS
ncbi:MAG: SDR family NAD(P)-dependent oxidoreductase [Lentisphaeria bacterium]|nr:SDR family NAD(P)-dependent oxidoreductase [Lentisphaeria bacterium]